MFYLNIRSIPDHFTELTSLLINLETEIKVIAISETWLKPSHINFNIPIYNMEQELHPKKRASGVALYLYNVLQYIETIYFDQRPTKFLRCHAKLSRCHRHFNRHIIGRYTDTVYP